MNYQKHYDLLINRAKNRVLSGYKEKHHIIPRCVGGGDEYDNLVNLTAREHFVAHQLLIKIYPGNCKLIYAAKMMTVVSSDHKNSRSKNKLYEWLRIKANAAMTGQKHSAAHRLKNSNAQKGKTPWNKGLTKETDIRVKKYAINSGVSRKGKSSHKKGKPSGKKNQTYEEIYGIEEAKRLKDLRKIARIGKPSHNLGKIKVGNKMIPKELA